jgi:hypothetical protein
MLAGGFGWPDYERCGITLDVEGEEGGPGNREEGSGIRDQGSGVRDQGRGFRDQGSGVCPLPESEARGGGRSVRETNTEGGSGSAEHGRAARATLSARATGVTHGTGAGQFPGEAPSTSGEAEGSKNLQGRETSEQGSRPTRPESRALVWDLGRADDLYQASKNKYKSTGIAGYRSDSRSQLDGLVVECCLRKVGYPPLLTGLLLWLYPTCGDFVPLRPGNWDPENPFRSFRPRLWMAETCGTVVSKYGEQAVDRLLRQLEVGFRATVAEALRGGVWVRRE